MKRMRTKSLTLLCLLVSINLFVQAQQKPHYTQYIINPYIINPALTGIENYVDIKLGHRHQWVGLRDGPVTSYATINAPIGKQDYNDNIVTIFSMEGNNPRGKQYWDEYRATAPHHGIGIQILNDRTGPFNNLTVMGTYAYHMRLNAKTNLSAGIAVGTSKYTINTEKLFFGIDYPVDPAVYGTGKIGESKLDMNAGLWLYSSHYFAGFSMNQLLPQALDFSGNFVKASKGKFVPHYFATAGYRFLLTEDINMVPSIMIKKITPIPTQVEVNVKALFRDVLWAGATYRAKYGFAAMAGFNVLNRFFVSYSYDYSTTKINTVSSGTHEVVIGFVIGNKYSDDTCPRNVW